MKNYCVESEFTFKGLKCVVVMQDMGHRCGYVGVPKEHLLFGKKYDEWEVEGLDVHGGITYSDKDGEYPIPSDLWWFGFDCAHYGDAPDYEAAKKLFSDDLDTVRYLEERKKTDKKCGIGTHGVIRSCEYVKAQCRKLADQLEHWLPE